MTSRSSNHPIASRLLAGALGVAVLLTATAIPVAAGEPTETPTEVGPQASVTPVEVPAPSPSAVDVTANTDATSDGNADLSPAATSATDPSSARSLAVTPGASTAISDAPPPARAAKTAAEPAVTLAEAPFTVTGKVRTVSGTPVAGATVGLVGGGVSSGATTDTGGSYSLMAVSGSHTLTFGSYASVQATLTVSAAAPTIDLTVPDPTTLTIRVRDVNDLPVEGASVSTYFTGDALATFEIAPGVWATGTTRPGGDRC